ncbi:MAG TPA: DUF2232 domain-containing protein [Ktedonobacterales bacterium]|nr:DUF2232 domain-containing protein [Ktedonobacterales bacterium]
MDEPAINMDEMSASPLTPEPMSGGEPQTQETQRAHWASAISMAEAGLLTDVSLVFDLAWIYVPILGTAFMPLIPTPFVILYLRRGARITVFAAFVAGFLMTVLVGPHYGWRLTLEAIIGLAMGWAMRRRWSPLVAITVALFINSTVAYVAAFSAVFALGLPLHDLYLELRNILVGVDWLIGSSAQLLGLTHTWLHARPFFSAVAHFTLTYWIPMFYLYVVALAAPVVVLYYSVSSTTAYALGHDVRPFPTPWMWRVVRFIGLALSPFFWLARMLWRVVTVPLWGPLWLARTIGARRRRSRLRSELARTGAQTSLAAPSTATVEAASDGANSRQSAARMLEAAGRGREAHER